MVVRAPEPSTQTGEIENTKADGAMPSPVRTALSSSDSVSFTPVFALVPFVALEPFGAAVMCEFDARVDVGWERAREVELEEVWELPAAEVA